jgi:hypothetical protein
VDVIDALHRRADDVFIPGESILHVMQAFNLQKIARRASMGKRAISEAIRPKRKYIDVPSTFDTLSINISHFVMTHLGRKLAQLLAYVQLFPGKSKQRIRFGQISLNA